MKRNFLVTTNLTNTWEFEENNFLLGDWCKFPEINNFDKDQYEKKNNKKININNNKHHWENNDKRFKDYEYLNKTLEHLVIIISENLSLVHNVNENTEYWRPIIYGWLNQYVMTIFDRWESVRLFFEKNKDLDFYSNFITQDDLNFIPNDHINFTQLTQNDYWNHLIFLRILFFLNLSNLSFIEKKNDKNIYSFKKKNEKKNLSLRNEFIKFIDNLIANFAFKFNKIIFESFRFPKKDFLKICFKFNLIPSLYISIFNFKIKESNFTENKKRNKFKDLLFNQDSKDKFIKFLLLNIYKDIPRTYLENFDKIKNKIFPLAKSKKTIFSMHSLTFNDNFKIYVAETKKFGSKFIYVNHGGGLTTKMEPYFDFVDKVADKQVVSDDVVKKNFVVKLSPTWPITNIKSKKTKLGKDCTIVFIEKPRHIIKFITGPLFSQTIDLFDEITKFVNSLKPEIKSNIKFRVKTNYGFNSVNKFSKLFGKKTIDKVTLKNSFQKSIFNSKLVIVTYPHTAFSESMRSNIPTIIIVKKNHWNFTESASHIFELLKKNKIAFTNFEDAKKHIDKYWNELDLWWESDSVQLARKRYLELFFNVKPDWFREWSDFIHSQSIR